MSQRGGRRPDGEPVWWSIIQASAEGGPESQHGLQRSDFVPLAAEELEGMVLAVDSAPDDTSDEAAGMTSVRADLPADVVKDIEALARLSERTPAAELNHAASFWIYARRLVAEGGTILVRNRGGRVGKVDLTGSTEPPVKS